MEEVMSLRDQDQVLLARELGNDYEVEVTGWATPAQSPSLSQQGFQLWQRGMALFVKDKERRNYYITVIDFIRKSKVMEVCVTPQLVYTKDPRETRCHSTTGKNGVPIGVIFEDPRKADLFYDSVTKRIQKQKKSADRKAPSSPHAAKPRCLDLNVRPQFPFSPPQSLPVKPKPNFGHPLPRPNWGVQPRPPIPRPDVIVNHTPVPETLPLTTLTTSPTTPPTIPALTSSPRINSRPTRTVLACKKRLEQKPPQFDEHENCPSDAATLKSRIFMAPRRFGRSPDDNRKNGPKLKPLPHLPKGATPTSRGTAHIANHDERVTNSFQDHGEHLRLPPKPVPNQNTLPVQPASTAPWTPTQKATETRQFQMPPFETGSSQTSSPISTVASLSSSRPFNPPVTLQRPTMTPHLRGSWSGDSTTHPVSQESSKSRNRSLKTSPTPSWTHPASQVSWEPQDRSSSAVPPWTTPASQESWEPKSQPPTTSDVPSSISQSRDPELALPRYPIDPLPIQNLSLHSDSEEFPPPPPPENWSEHPHSNGFTERPHNQNTPVQAVDSKGTLLQSLISNNPRARLRKVEVDQSGQSPRPAASGGGNDMMSSLHKELMKRKKVIQDPIYMGELESDNEDWDEEWDE